MKNNSTMNNPLIFLRAFKMVNSVPMVSLDVEGKELNFIIDTGSAMSIIDKKVLASSMFSQKIEKTDISLGGIDNNRNIQEKIKLSFAADDMNFETTFLVHDCSSIFGIFLNSCNTEIAGLLGSEFLAKYQIVIDFSKNAIYIFNPDYKQ